MRRCRTISAADWLVAAQTPWQQLVTFGPGGFDAYARVRYLPDPEFVGQRENELRLTVDRPSNLEVARRALYYLARFTTTADRCYFCVWDGYLDDHSQQASEQIPVVATEHRSFALFTAPLEDISYWQQTFAQAPEVPPAFVWPADRAWCLASDVDPHWAGVGAERAAIDALVKAADLDAVRADPELPPPAYT